MAHDVFISYSHKDKAVADAACAALEREGIRVWIAPRDISPGAEWGGAIIDAINNARAMVLIFSANANDSPQIRREVERAVNKEVPILPFRIEAVEPTQSLEYFIGTLHWLDALSPPMDSHIGRLTHTIKALLTAPATDPEAAEAVAANKAARRATALPPIPPVPAHRTNWLMWTAIIVGMSGVILIAALWIIMSARKAHPDVATLPPPGGGTSVPAIAIPNVPAVPRPPAARVGYEKWSGVDYRAGDMIPAASDMQLKFNDDGTITGSSTEVRVSLGSAPVRQAVISGKVDGTTITLTKSFGDASGAIVYTGVIDADHTSMSGTWQRGAEKGTFSANLAGGRDRDEDDDEP